MEFCATGDLSKCLWQNKNNFYGERTIKMISCQLLQGLQALHKNGIIHCNLKPSNILIDEYGNVKICDFKKSLKVATMNMKDIKKNKTAMTPCYTAPELFQEDGKYSFKSDLWALGCIMYELAVGQVPFFDENIAKLINKIINDDVDFNKKELTKYSDEFVQILKRLLVKEPNNRVTWGEIERFDWWEGALFDSNVNNPQSGKSDNNNKGIDALRLSRIVRNNLDKENYTNVKKNEIDNTDQEFDFQDKETDDEDLVQPEKLNISISKFPMNVSVLNISKVFKKDKRTYNDINAELIQSSNDDMPKIENFFIHPNDRVIKPIIGNKLIEDTPITTFNKSKLPFVPWKKDVLKDMMNSPNDVKTVEQYLYRIYTDLDDHASKNDFDNLLNLLRYFETIVFDRELANNLINTSFIQQFIQFLKNLNNEDVKTRCCCIIGYLVRYATIIEVPLDNYNFGDIICNTIRGTNNNSDLMKKATATLGEYLFYVATQEETPDNNEWSISKNYLDILLYCLNEKRGDIVNFYTIKTIENIAILTNVSKKYFASNPDFVIKILDVYNNTNNVELKCSAVSTVSHLIRHQPSLINNFLEKCNILNDDKVILKENENIQLCLINCLLFSFVKDVKNVFLANKCELFIGTILKVSEKCNNIIKIKIILLLGYLLTFPKMIIKYGDKAFTKLQKYRIEKNNEIHIAVKFFEKMFIDNAILFSKNFINQLIKDNKHDEILMYCNTFFSMGNYHRISNPLFTVDFLKQIISYIKSKASNKGYDEIISNLLNVLMKFSENPISVIGRIDYILSGLYKDLLNLSDIIKINDVSSVITICANILSFIIDYAEGKQNEIKKLIKTCCPIFLNLLKKKEITEETLSLMSLIIEKDETFISIYLSEGIIDEIFKLMKNKDYSTNLNIIKILIIFTQYKGVGFNEIMKINLIDKVNYLISKGLESDDESIYMDYVFELFNELIEKIADYKRKNYSSKVDLDSYKKNFQSKIENVAKNFQLCIDLLGNDKNVNVQEMACQCLVFILQFFPGSNIESLKMKLNFKPDDIPKLLKGLELSCHKIHKRMIQLFIWIIEYQNDGKKILKPYVSYITTYLENICNTTAEPDIINTAQKFMNQELVKIK